MPATRPPFMLVHTLASRRTQDVFSNLAVSSVNGKKYQDKDSDLVPW